MSNCSPKHHLSSHISSASHAEHLNKVEIHAPHACKFKFNVGFDVASENNFRQHDQHQKFFQKSAPAMDTQAGYEPKFGAYESSLHSHEKFVSFENFLFSSKNANVERAAVLDSKEQPLMYDPPTQGSMTSAHSTIAHGNEPVSWTASLSTNAPAHEPSACEDVARSRERTDREEIAIRNERKRLEGDAREELARRKEQDRRTNKLYASAGHQRNIQIERDAEQHDIEQRHSSEFEEVSKRNAKSIDEFEHQQHDAAARVGPVAAAIHEYDISDEDPDTNDDGSLSNIFNASWIHTNAGDSTHAGQASSKKGGGSVFAPRLDCGPQVTQRADDSDYCAKHTSGGLSPTVGECGYEVRDNSLSVGLALASTASNIAINMRIPCGTGVDLAEAAGETARRSFAPATDESFPLMIAKHAESSSDFPFVLGSAPVTSAEVCNVEEIAKASFSVNINHFDRVRSVKDSKRDACTSLFETSFFDSLKNKKKKVGACSHLHSQLDGPEEAPIRSTAAGSTQEIQSEGMSKEVEKGEGGNSPHPSISQKPDLGKLGGEKPKPQNQQLAYGKVATKGRCSRDSSCSLHSLLHFEVWTGIDNGLADNADFLSSGGLEDILMIDFRTSAPSTTVQGHDQHRVWERCIHSGQHIYRSPACFGHQRQRLYRYRVRQRRR
jgi:hypothetical protein